MAATISVPYQIDTDTGITEANPPGEPTAVVRFTCAARDRYQLVRDLVGTTVQSGRSIVRTFPLRYPPSPNMIARSIESIETRGKSVLLPGLSLPWLFREKAYVTCRFGVATWDGDGSKDPSGQPYTTTTFGCSGEFLTLPDTTYRFPSGLPTNTPIGIILPQVEISMQRHMMPYPPIAEVAAASGHVSSTVMNFGGFAMPTGTVLFLGGDSTIQADTLGNLIFETTYKMTYRYIPWNYYLSPSRTEGWAAVTDGSGNNPYPTYDLNTLP